MYSICMCTNELSLCHKTQFSNTYISKTRWRKPLVFQTLIIWSMRIHSLIYLGSTTLGSRHKGIKNKNLWQWLKGDREENRSMLGTIPKDSSQVGTSQGYFPKWELPKCAISQAETSQVCPSRSVRPLLRRSEGIT